MKFTFWSIRIWQHRRVVAVITGWFASVAMNANRFDSVKKILRNKFFTRGAPLFFFMFVALVELREFVAVRHEFSNRTLLMKEEIEKTGIKIKKQEEVTLESVYEDVKKLDIDNWENKRIPRPYDETI